VGCAAYKPKMAVFALKDFHTTSAQKIFISALPEDWSLISWRVWQLNRGAIPANQGRLSKGEDEGRNRNRYSWLMDADVDGAIPLIISGHKRFSALNGF
jgi:hypothetical protein